MKLAPEADKIAASIVASMSRGKPLPSWDTIRDCCDLARGGELDMTKLDILADMVERRVAKAAQRKDP